MQLLCTHELMSNTESKTHKIARLSSTYDIVHVLYTENPGGKTFILEREKTKLKVTASCSIPYNTYQLLAVMSRGQQQQKMLL